MLCLLDFGDPKDSSSDYARKPRGTYTANSVEQQDEALTGRKTMLSRHIHNVSPRLDAMLGCSIACVHQYRRNKSAFLASPSAFPFCFQQGEASQLAKCIVGSDEAVMDGEERGSPWPMLSKQTNAKTNSNMSSTITKTGGSFWRRYLGSPERKRHGHGWWR